jgi:hypothetical protein
MGDVGELARWNEHVEGIVSWRRTREGTWSKGLAMGLASAPEILVARARPDMMLRLEGILRCIV